MKIANETFDQERALYGLHDATIQHCSFDGPADGESALKEVEDIHIDDVYFNLRYPLWHASHIVIKKSTMTPNCRAALWYDSDVRIEDSTLSGIKALRECHGSIHLKNDVIESPEFGWRSSDITIQDSQLISEYPFFECQDMEIDHLEMKGKYSFQYTKNIHIKNSVLDTKDAFWHADHVLVEDSVVKGEYLGWYSNDVKFVRCKIIGTQPLCYCKNLVLEDCTMEQTDLSFERSEVEAHIKGSIESVKNPKKGRIVADSIEEIILEPEYIDPAQTEIVLMHE